jgi:hypothetical protein
LPDFNVKVYLEDHPETLIAGEDPYEASYLEKNKAGTA